MTKQQAEALRAVAQAIIEAVREGEKAGAFGAPGGSIYAALMGHGISLAQYEQLMAGMVGAGLLVKRGQLYFTA